MYNRTTVQCKACGSFVVPRMDIYYGQPVATFCPICGNMIEDFSPAWAKYIPHFIGFILAAAFIFCVKETFF
ncbi:hypothetical protein Dacet_0718 [Denitrovibrio acetiphilus DSM 12809]|uniref:Uncharacterized protein n=1 Tax=Denitrovibrio acetiphilus (strain DSM 12809 / NBRC 114555 / N2460) TaxID=522772 RepID=D4H4V8_DENA2|nr:hypothetical protein [Denitrovibrio acetiphilus]ADD67502.1 hypothetical protein Dacet_0718 [Denitrovibrio acetiphilus DSM 12809]